MCMYVCHRKTNPRSSTNMYHPLSQFSPNFPLSLLFPSPCQKINKNKKKNTTKKKKKKRPIDLYIVRERNIIKEGYGNVQPVRKNNKNIHIQK